MNQKAWKLMMGYEYNADKSIQFFYQVVSIPDNEIIFEFNSRIKHRSSKLIRRVLRLIKPDKKIIIKDGYYFTRDQILLIYDGVKQVNNSEQEINCRRLGAISSKIPIIIMEFFKNE